jgi:hypothetical protein
VREISKRGALTAEGAASIVLSLPLAVAGALVLVHGHDGAVLVAPAGRRQPLCGAYDAALLRAAGAGDTHGMPVRELVRGLDLAEVRAAGDEARDVDTWADVRALRESLEAGRRE